jgi:hypothetical protein
VTAERVETALPVAVQLIGAVRDCDRRAVAELLLGADMPALAITLAAMVDDEQRLADLLSWTEFDLRLHPLCDPSLDGSPASSTSPHGTRSRHNKGCRGAACKAAESEYQRGRYQRDRERRQAS